MSEGVVRGSCLCGGIRYEAEGALTDAVFCHCTMCQKSSGTVFATNASVPVAGFRIVEGEALLAQYESSPGQWRCFCARCGSPIVKRYDDDRGFVRIRLGSLDDPVKVDLALHLHVASKVPWFDITDGKPQVE